jgi:hypothetical protein
MRERALVPVVDDGEGPALVPALAWGIGSEVADLCWHP